MKRYFLIQLLQQDKIVPLFKLRITDKTTPEKLFRFLEKIFKKVEKP
jgi:hypothetical protein